MLEWYENRNVAETIRQPIRELRKQQRSIYDYDIAKAINFFNRNGDVDDVRDEMVIQLATRIVSEKEKKDNDYAGSSATDTEWYFERGNLALREIPAKAILNGQIGAVNTGLGIRIIQALSTLFSQANQSWMWVKGDDKKANVNDVEALVRGVRNESGFGTAVSQWDMMSCMVESSILHIYYKGSELRYDVVQPQNVYVKYGSRLVYEYADGTKEKSYVDHTEIEDASAVIIRMSSNGGDYDSTPDMDQFLAYVGSCEDFKEGRYVVYRAREPWPIPEHGTADGKYIDYEHMEGSTPCNPLTWMRHYGTDEERASVSTEYPIALFRGGHRIIDSGNWAPTTTSLYENCKQIEIAWSLVLRYAIKGARGVDVFKTALNSLRSPKNLDVIRLDADENEDYDKKGWPASNAKDATAVVSTVTEQVGGGFDVPGFYLLGQLTGMNPASGIALAMQTEPLINRRERRTALNRDAVSRVFDIERAWLHQRHPAEVAGLLTPDIKQIWYPGTWEIPGDSLVDAEVIALKLQTGVIDRVGAVKKEHHLSTDDEAVAYIKKMAKRDPNYPARPENDIATKTEEDDNQVGIEEGKDDEEVVSE